LSYVLREAKFNTSNIQLYDNLLSSAMFQLYHGENKLDDNFRFVANTNVIVFGLTRSGGHNRKKSQQQRRVEETCPCPMCHEA
jgi:hypothetical protein